MFATVHHGVDVNLGRGLSLGLLGFFERALAVDAGGVVCLSMSLIRDAAAFMRVVGLVLLPISTVRGAVYVFGHSVALRIFVEFACPLVDCLAGSLSWWRLCAQEFGAD